MTESDLPSRADDLAEIAACLAHCTAALDRVGLVIAANYADHARALVARERFTLRLRR